VRTIVVELLGRKIFVLNGLPSSESERRGLASRELMERLRAAVRKNPDAVAFGCTAGRWVAAA
jgi:hypothetical protein